MRNLLIRLAALALLAGCTHAPPPETKAPVDAEEPGPDQARASSRAANLLRNGDFEQATDAGLPEHWGCTCFQKSAAPRRACQVVEGGTHGSHALELSPACGAYQVVKGLDPSRPTWADVEASGLVAQPPAQPPLAVYVTGADGGLRGNAADRWYPVAGQGGAVELLTSTPAPAGGEGARVMLLNAGPAPARYDDALLLQTQPAFAPGLTLLEGVHHAHLALNPGAAPAEVWMPLPADAESQTLLSEEVTALPAAAVERLDYARDAHGNRGVTLRFKASAAPVQVELGWRAVVLVRRARGAERSRLFAAESDPRAWLAATPLADPAQPDVAHAAESLGAAGQPAEAQVQAVLNWTTAHLVNRVQPGDALDASSVVRSGRGTCTGFANAADALGRARGLPARAVAGVLVGAPLAVHSFSELYLGPEQGWRRVEPQSRAPEAPDDGLLVLRLVLPADEAAAALAPAPPSHRWAAPGVPLDTLEEPRAGQERLGALEGDGFPGYPGTYSQALPLARLSGPPSELAALFARARAAWRADEAELLSRGSLSSAARSHRVGAREVRTLAALHTLLDAASRP